MISVTKYKLAKNLLGNIVIFNQNDETVYIGEEIDKLFQSHDISINTSAKNEKSRTFQTLLESEIANVRNTTKAATFKFQGMNIEFHLFPENGSSKDFLILSTQKKIQQINKIELDLRERVKELECLYNISHELEFSKNLDTAFEATTKHLERGFQFPEFTSVCFDISGKTYGDACAEDMAAAMLKEKIFLNKKQIGEIKVCYLQKASFLEEERKLIKEVAGKLARAKEKDLKKKNLENKRKILLSKNKELTKLSEEYNESKESLRTFFNAITDIIIVIDTDFNIIMSNKERIGESGKCYKKIFNSDKVCESCPAVGTFKKGEPGSLEKRLFDEDYLLKTYPIINKKGTVTSVLEVCRDITKEKQLEFQLFQSYKLASLGKLVAGIAHEINNPNTFILGNTKFIKEAFHDILPLLDQFHEEEPNLTIARLKYELFRENIMVLMSDMENGAKRMKKIVEDLRNYARKEEETRNDDVNINDVIENSMRLVKNQIKRKADISYECEPKIPIFKGNANKLEQVVLNMLLNASQAIENKKGKIDVKAGFNKAKGEIFIEIADNGKGIDKSTRKFIFDPFFTTKRNNGGTGLGLAICYGIIKEHNGHIEVQTRRNSGTVFTIFLPV